MAYICFVRRDEEGNVHEERRIALDAEKETTLGGDESQVDVLVDDPKASGLHCKIRSDGVNYWIIDLASHNGIKVNHKRVDSSPLLDGYIFKIGRTYLRFHSGDKRQKQSKDLDTDEGDDSPLTCDPTGESQQ